MVGQYSVALPDGRIQHVSYSADTIHGNIMEVTYEGEAHHPDLHLAPVLEHPDPAIPPPQPLGARFERDAATLAKSDPSQPDKYDFSGDIKPFIDFGFSRYQDEDIFYDDDDDYDYDYDYDYDTIIQALFPSPRRQRSLESLLDGPLFREYF